VIGACGQCRSMDKRGQADACPPLPTALGQLSAFGLHLTTLTTGSTTTRRKRKRNGKQKSVTHVPGLKCHPCPGLLSSATSDSTEHQRSVSLSVVGRRRSESRARVPQLRSTLVSLS